MSENQDIEIQNARVLILELLKGEECSNQIIQNCMEASVDQSYLLGKLGIHRIAAYAYWILNKRNLLKYFNREFTNVLKTIYMSSCEQSKIFRQNLAYLAELFQNAKFPYAVLKGAQLINLYPEGTRTSNDIDILVNREDVPDVTHLLKNQGFQQGILKGDDFFPASRRDIVNALLNRGETIPFVKRLDYGYKPYMELDINISVNESSIQTKNTVKQMLEHTLQIIHTEQGDLYTLDIVDFLLHLCAHLYKEASVFQWVKMGRDLSLYKFLDVRLFWDAYMTQEYFSVLVNRVTQYGLQDAFNYTFFYLSNLWGFDDEQLNEYLRKMDSHISDVMNTVYDLETKVKYSYIDNLNDRIFNDSHRNNLIKYNDGTRGL